MVSGVRWADVGGLPELPDDHDAGWRGATSLESPALSSGGVWASPEAVSAGGRGAIALPQHEFGLDVVALVGALRYAEHAACRRFIGTWSGVGCRSVSG